MIDKPKPSEAVAEPGHRGARGPGTLPIVLVLVQLFFASFPVAGKIALEAMPAAAIALWRVATGSVVLLLLARICHPRDWLPERRTLVPLCLVGQLGVSLNQILFVEGLTRAPALHAGLIMALIPSTTYAAALLMRCEGWAPRRALGIGVAFLGAATLIAMRGAAGGGGGILGHLFLVLNATSYSFYLVLVRPLTQRTPPLVALAWSFAGSLPAVLVYGFLVAGTGVSGLLPPTPESRNALLCILLFPTILAYTLNLWALARVEASTAALYVNLQPLIAAVLAVSVMGDRFGAAELSCGLLILLGMRLVTRLRR